MVNTELADVSKTGDTKYSIVSKDGIPTYITALLYEPLNTNITNITIDGEDYEKSTDGIWKDKDGKVKEFKQEDICIYYINPKTETQIHFHRSCTIEMKFIFQHIRHLLLTVQIS